MRITHFEYRIFIKKFGFLINVRNLVRQITIDKLKFLSLIRQFCSAPLRSLNLKFFTLKSTSKFNFVVDFKFISLRFFGHSKQFIVYI